MFYQDPFLLYQQTPFCHGNSSARNPQNRSSFRIDDILVPRQPFLVPKQPSFQEPRSSVPNANPLKFGMHSILTQRQRDDVPIFQGGLVSRPCLYFLVCTPKFHCEPIWPQNQTHFLHISNLSCKFLNDFAPCHVGCFYGFNCWLAKLRKNYPFVKEVIAI